MTSNFAQYLVAMRSGARVAAISRSSADEFRGWRRMVRAAGHQGPQICEVELPVHAQPSAPEHLDHARQLLCIPGSPLVLVVGSHEPRKNHLAVLHAAELLWRDGLSFTLAFRRLRLVGGPNRSTTSSRAAGALPAGVVVQAVAR